MEISGLGEGQQLHLCLVLGREGEVGVSTHPPKMTLAHPQMSKQSGTLQSKRYLAVSLPTG